MSGAAAAEETWCSTSAAVQQGTKRMSTTDGSSEGQEKGELVTVAAGLRYDDVCEYCSIQPAEIFQVTGNFCIICWQELTHPNVEEKRPIALKATET